MALQKVKTGVKSQKDYGPCEQCGTEIRKGDLYQWMKGFRGPKRKRCAACPTWTTAQRETGPLASAYEAQEVAHAALDALTLDSYDPYADGIDQNEVWSKIVDDIKTILSDCAEQAASTIEQFEESLDNMGEGLSQGPTGQDIEEKKDTVQGWIDDSLENWSPEDEAPQPDTGEEPEDWFEGIIEQARTAVDELEA